MTPGARLAAAIAVLDVWLAGQPVEQALTRWARGARYAGSKDRAAVRDHVYDVLRRKGSCAAASGAMDGRGLVLGLLRLQGADPESLFSGDGHAPPALTDAERGHAVPEEDPARDVPDWVLPLFRDQAGEDLPTLLDAFTRRAPVWLRVNLRRGTRAEAAERLTGDGIATRPHPEVATALEVTEGARAVRRSAAYETGLVELQDLSVQAALARIDWPASGRILDYCAGGGGKSLALADRTDARITAHDAFPRRMADLGPRAARAGVRIEEVSTGSLSGTFDAVLLDVPCSGSGTWRRDPEAKWRLPPEAVERLTETQGAILAEGARLVRPGGRLVYMTCSLLEAENGDRIAAFLGAHEGWREDARHLDTPLSASDGFFSCVLVRDRV